MMLKLIIVDQIVGNTLKKEYVIKEKTRLVEAGDGEQARQRVCGGGLG